MALNLLIDLGIIIIAGTLIALLARHLKQPLILAYILAGLIIGPIGFKLIPDINDIKLLAELGIAFLLFAIGIESNIRQLFKQKFLVIGGALIQVIATTVITFGLMQFANLTLIQSLCIGFILAFSSTVIVIKMLSEKKLLNTMHGRIMIGFLLVQDAIAIIVLPLFSGSKEIFSFNAISGFAFSLIILIIMALILNKVALPALFKRFGSENETFYLILLSTCFAFIGVAYYLQFSIAIGAFIAGLSLSTLSFNTEASNKIKGLRDFFATIFFVAIGMQITLAFTSFPLLVVIGMLAVLYIINPLIYFTVCYFGGLKARTSFFIGISLLQASEFSFIIANEALTNGFINPELFSLAILMITISMASTPYLMNASNWIFDCLRVIPNKLLPKKILMRKSKEDLENLPKNQLKNHLVLFGAGMFGNALIPLLQKRIQLVIVDHDPEIIEKLIKQKISAVYGNIENEEIWDKVNVWQAKIVVIGGPDSKESKAMIQAIKKENPDVIIIDRALNYKKALDLYEWGVDFVSMPLVIAGNETLKKIIDLIDGEGKECLMPMKKESLKLLKEKANEESEE